MRRTISIGAVMLALVTVLAVAGAAWANDEAKPDLIHWKPSVSPATAGYLKQHGPHSQAECTQVLAGLQQLLDCDDPFPNNEPQIAVDPSDPRHLIGSSNDYGSCCDEAYTSFDRGTSWLNGNMSRQTPQVIGSDPVTVFDVKHGVAVHLSLNFTVAHANGTQTCDGDVVASASSDGGRSWAVPKLVANGTGCDLSKAQVFNDKEWGVVDNNASSPHYGRIYVTWTAFLSNAGVFARAPIMLATSDDGGKTWSAAVEISGSNAALCTYQETGPAAQCDEDQASVPVVLPSGDVVVAFLNSQDQAAWASGGGAFADQYLVVRSHDGGATWSSPVRAAALFDGADAFPVNVDGRQTLSGYQVRIWSAGNLAVDPVSGNLALVWADNRHGTAAATNADVFVVWSHDGGRSWSSSPQQVTSGAGDQWFPWAAFNPVDHRLGVVYNSRAAVGAAVYDARLAVGVEGGSFGEATVSSATSDPTDSVFFQAGVAGCQKCATFMGDYNGLDYGSDGRAHAVWTDMRADNNVPALGPGKLQFIAYASRP